MNFLRSLPAWKASKKVLLDPLRRACFETLYRDWLPLAYYDDPNWGDALNPVLAHLLSGQRVKKMLWHHQHRHLMIGSILGKANARTEVWGSGFMWADERLPEVPQAVHAVRGPRSRAKLLKQGIDCPEIYGDPALLFPWFFNPPVEKTHAVGIIPHYIDSDHPWVMQHQDPQVRIIDVRCGIGHFVEAVKSCELIISSSLHGLICADAYGVPNLWIELSGKVCGGHFKYLDYFESVGREITLPVRPDETTSLGMVTRHLPPCKIKIDLQPLIAACPFLSPPVRRKLLETPGSFPQT